MRDQLIAWLNDAYAMEQGLIPVLQSHASDAVRDLPHAARRLEEHITETRMHAQRLELCLRELGTTPSTVKSTLSSLLGAIEGASTGVFRDASVKNVLADYGSEQFEVGCYRALVAAARHLGLDEIASRCEMNLREDEQMAMWLWDQIPAVVERSLQATT